MISLFHWLGGKARHAHEFAGMLASELPIDGHYYEGFAGAASVAIVLGTIRPDANIYITDSNPVLCAALRLVRDSKDHRPVVERMRAVCDLPTLEARKIVLHTDHHGDDPIRWLAAANCVRAAHNVWPYEPGQIERRIRQMPDAWREAHRGLKKAEIKSTGFQFHAFADVVYADPPYYNSTFKYDTQIGELEDWFPVYRDYQNHGKCKFMLITDSMEAAPFYKRHLNLDPILTGKRLKAGIREVYEGDVEGYYAWKRT